MTDTMNHFLETVSSLKNISIGEDFKTVGTLLSDLKKSNQLTSKDWNEIISKIRLDSNLEKMIVMEIINRWRLSEKVIEALKSDDLFIIGQAIKCSWFFRDDCGLLINSRLFVREFLPHLSVASRQRVLKNYGRFLRDETKADNLFLAVEDEYGTTVPLALLPACSESFISSVLQRKTVLTAEIVFQLYLYHPLLTLDYISSLLNHKEPDNRYNPSNFTKIFLRLISKDTRKFVEMFDKYGNLIHISNLGRNLIKKIVKTDFDSILRNVNNYMKILDMKSLLHCLSHVQIRQLHFALMPVTLMAFKNSLADYYHNKSIDKLNKHLKKSLAEEMMLNNFIKKYNIEPLNVPFKLTKTFIKCLPKEQRSLWAEKEINANPDLSFHEKVDYMSYLMGSLSKLKRMLPEALSPEARGVLVESMMESVRMSGNVNQLNDVITFVIEKLRNDLEMVKVHVMSPLSRLDLLQLEVDRWTNIFQLVDILKMNNEHHRHQRAIMKLVHLYTRRRLMEGLDVEQQMRELLSEVTSYEFELDKGDSVQHFILNWFNENINIEDKPEDDQKSISVKLFLAINEWNSKYPTRISHKAWLIEFIIKNCFKSYYRGEIITSLKKHPELKRKMFDSFPSNTCEEILLHRLHYDPGALLDKIDIFYDGVKKSHSPSRKYFLKRLKIYNRGELVTKLKEYCLSRFNSEDESVGDKCSALVMYSYLCTGAELLSAIEGYYPEQDRADTAGEAHQLYRLQTAAAASLKNIDPPYSVMPALDKFLRGDYLKLSLGSLNSVIVRTSQIKSLHYLNRKLDTPVSLRKNILRLHKAIAPNVDTCKLLFSCFKSEKNLSLRVILLQSMYSTLKEEQSEVAWTCVKDASQLLTEKDIAQIPSIFNLSFIPKQYTSDYIEAIWLRLDQLKDEKDMRQRIFTLITSDTITQLSDEFSTLLFHLTYTTEEVNQSNSYISLFLSMREENFETRLSLVLGLISSHFKEKWASLDEELCAVSQVQLSNLLKCVCSVFVTCSSRFTDPSAALTKLQQGVLQLFSEVDILMDSYNMSLHVEFLKSKVTIENLQQVSFINSVCSLVDHYCNTYGEALIHVLCSSFKGFIYDKLISYEMNYDVNLLIAHKIICSDASKMNKIMALKLMPTFTTLTRENDMNRFKEIVGIITQSPITEIKVLTKVHVTNK